MKYKLSQRIGDILFLIMVFFGIIYLIACYLFANESSILDKLVALPLNEGWVRVFADDSRKSVELPAYFDTAKDEDLVLEITLPEDLLDEDWYCVRSVRQNLFVYVDGELRSQYFQDNTSIFRSEPVSRYVFVKLKKDDSGKTMRLVGQSNTERTHGFNDSFYGDRASILYELINHYSFSLLSSVAYFICGILFIVWGTILAVMTKYTIRLDYIGWSLTAVSLWNFTQSEYRDFFFSNIKAVSIVPAYVIMLLPITMILYFNVLQEFRYRKIYIPYVGFSFLVDMTFIVLQVLKKYDIYESLNFSFVLVFGVFVLFVITCIKDYQSKFIEKYVLVVIAVCVLAVCSLLQMFSFIVTPNTITGVYLTSGYFVFAILSFFHAFKVFEELDDIKKENAIGAEIKNRFLTSMSHEIRTPLNAVLGMNEAIMRETHEDEIMEYAKDVDNAGHLLLGIINDIFDYSNLDSGKLVLEKGTYSLTDIINNARSITEKRAYEKGLDLMVEVDQSLPNDLEGDAQRVTQIIVNLLTNAVKYTDTGSVRLLVSGQQAAGILNMVITVSDTGIGIKKEDQDKLFSKFQKIDADKNRQIEGTGLGLAIVGQLVSLMDGTIEVNSEYTKGSVFTVTFCQKIMSKRTLKDVSAQSLADPTKPLELVVAPGRRILVVDDVYLNLKVVEKLLDKSQIKIDKAKNAEECLQLVSKYFYDLIFLDHLMPNNDGIQTLKEMQHLADNKNVSTPIVMMTANATEGAKETYMSLGFTDYISKPISLEGLQDMIKKYIK